MSNIVFANKSIQPKYNFCLFPFYHTTYLYIKLSNLNNVFLAKTIANYVLFASKVDVTLIINVVHVLHGILYEVIKSM